MSFEKDQHVIRAITTGILDADSLNRLLAEMSLAVHRYDCKRILYDMRETTVALESHEIYYTPEKIRAAGFQDARRAFLISSEEDPDFSFYETVAANQGQIVRTFTVPDEAMAWLLS